MERALEAEMAEHLGHAKNEPVANSAGNPRNGKSKKTLKGEFGELPIDIPRDRHGSFGPQLIPKHQTRWSSFDDKILSLYARGMTAREIQGSSCRSARHRGLAHLDFLGDRCRNGGCQGLTGAPLDVVYLDCIHVKVRDTGTVRSKAVYLALGINLSSEKELLGIWIAQTEGDKFRLAVVTELKNRGVQDIFIACVDGLKGFPEAIEAVYPKTAAQLCIVHLVRYSLNYVNWKLRKAVAADLRTIYAAATVAEAEHCLLVFEEKWGKGYPSIAQPWRRNWGRIIYTTNAIESVNMSLRKITKSRGSFPNDGALLKLFYLALMNISQKWTMPLRDWKAALNRFADSV